MTRDFHEIPIFQVFLIFQPNYTIFLIFLKYFELFSEINNQKNRMIKSIVILGVGGEGV